MTTVVDLGAVAELAHAEALKHAPRTPARRAAVAVWVVATETRSIAAAKRALADCTDPATATAARELLHNLTEGNDT